MPKCCSECKFLNDNYDYPECIIAGVATEKRMAKASA